MARKRMVPPVTLKGAPVPVERMEGHGNTPAAIEAARVLNRRSRAALRTARPFEHPIIPGRRVR